MAVGLAVPVGVNAQGGASLVEGDEQAFKIIAMALSDNDSSNAFQQDLGLGSAMIFDINDPSIRSRIVQRLYTIFRTFERLELYKLDTTSINWVESTEDQTLRLDFNFINLESDELLTFSRTFKAGGGVVAT